MKHFLFTLSLILFSFSQCFSQISHGGRPHEWQQGQRLEIPAITLPAVDQGEALRQAELLDAQKDIPYQFGENIEVDLDINNSGTWETLSNGNRIWRLAVKSENALSLNFEFDSYHLPEGAKVFVYSPDRNEFKGSFTSENASRENSLGVGFVFDDELIIEYQEPAAVAGQGYLHINRITHGFRSVMGGIDMETENRGPFGNSGPCNVNINCDEGLPYQKEKKSVAVIVVNGSGICTGALVNNTAEDGTPYFLSANHCFGGNVSNWVFYFNFETPECDGEDSTAPTDFSVSGSSLVARNAGSDFLLLLLNESPPISYNVCYAGWDAHDVESSVFSGIGIHHPAGDVKKIAIDSDGPYHSTVMFQGTNTEMWWIDNWEVGVTQPGSSGSPLFNQVGRIIGQLAGGSSACSGTENNGGYDFYGRFGVSWIGNGTDAASLAPHLNPLNSGALEIGSYCPGSAALENDLSLVSIDGIENVVCGETVITPAIGIYNSGDNEITEFELQYYLNGTSNTYTWEGSLPVSDYNEILLDGITLAQTDNEFSVEIVSVNNTTDTNPYGNSQSKSFLAALNPTYATVSITLDNFPEETSFTISRNDTIIYAVGNMEQFGDGGTYTETFCLPQDCYTFTIYDVYGDGICCNYGAGSFEVLLDGAPYVEGSSFGSAYSAEFCTFPTGIDQNRAVDFRLYPNPATQYLTWEFDSPHKAVVKILDQVGKVIFETTSTEVRATADISFLSAGIYIVQITTNGITSNQKLVISK